MSSSSSSTASASAIGWILLVDDHEDGRDLLSEYLSMSGFSVESCASGEDALDRIAQLGGAPSIVVTDLSLGSGAMNGVDLAKQLKASPMMKGVPILAVTGHADYQDADGLFNAVLVKPIALADLSDLVHAAVPRP